ncbi:MAG: T9SS type A sorting domain-containing protein [Bacteroidales bacterium]|nr:T9SS type A sorting domain-containing protein [Bacteroidales bacterium]
MKNVIYCLLLCSLVLLCQCTKAQNQNNGILYTDFNPDIRLIENYEDTLGLDFDQDGNEDLLVYFKHFGSVASRFGACVTSNGNWECAYCEGIDVLSEPHPDIATFGWSSIEGLMDPDYPNDRYGIRFQDAEGYRYGWIKMRCYVNQNTRRNEISIDKMAFCTIPNYPLRWGQTSLDADIEESPSTAFATIHPNPTTDIVTITGEKAIEAQVFNPLGQLVKTVQNVNEVSLKGLPSGLYLLRVTTKEGLVFTDKVVKE